MRHKWMIGLLCGALLCGSPAWAQDAETEITAPLEQAARDEQANAHKEAALAYDAFVKKYPTHAQARTAALGAVRAWGAAGDLKKAERAAQDVARLFGKKDLAAVIEASALMGDMYAGAAKPDAVAAKRWYKQAVTQHQRGGAAGDAAATHAAKAAFMLIEPDFIAWRDTPGARSMKEAQVRLKEDIKQSGALRERYAAVIAYKDATWVWAAALRTGQLYEQLAAKVRAIPSPFGPDDANHAIYTKALDEQAAPLEQRALQTYEQALASAKERGAQGEWVDKLRAASAALKARGVGATP
jgi:hypothetical protein